MRNKLSLVVVLAVAGVVAGCGLLGGGSADTGPKNSVEAVKVALGTKGVNVTGVTSLNDALGGKSECRPVERKRLNVSGGFVNVGNYGDATKAQACWNAYSGAGFPTGDMVMKGAWILEMKDSLPADTKTKAKDAFASAIR